MAAPELEDVPADASLVGAFSREIVTYNHGASDLLFLRPSGVAVSESWYALGTGGSVGSVDIGRWETIDDGVRLSDLLRMHFDCRPTEAFGSERVCTRSEERIPDRYFAYTDTEDGARLTEYLACYDDEYVTNSFSFDSPIVGDQTP